MLVKEDQSTFLKVPSVELEKGDRIQQVQRPGARKDLLSKPLKKKREKRVKQVPTNDPDRQECERQIRSANVILYSNKSDKQRLQEDIVEDLKTLRNGLLEMDTLILELKKYVCEKEAAGKVGLGDALGLEYRYLLAAHARMTHNIQITLKASNILKDLKDPIVNQSSLVQYLVGPEPPK